jgi:hypothetical protein
MDQAQSAPAGVVGDRARRDGRRARRGLRGGPALTLLAVSLGMMMVGIDGTIVAVANPSIQAQLHTSLPGIQWITNGYLLALAVLLIPAGKAGDRFGHKKVFLAGTAGFAAASAGVGLSGDIAHSTGSVIGPAPGPSPATRSQRWRSRCSSRASRTPASRCCHCDCSARCRCRPACCWRWP